MTIETLMFLGFTSICIVLLIIWFTVDYLVDELFGG